MTIPKILIASSVLALGVAMGVRKSSQQPPPPAPLALTIKTHGVQLTQQDAKAIISQSRTFLPQLPISLKSIISGGGSGIFKTCEEVNALLADKSANIHVVKSIGCCGGVQSGDIAGCSGPNLSIVALPVDSANHPENVPLVAVQWMHELGHNKGLCHNGTTGSLMALIPGAGNTATNQCERNAFLGLPASSSCPASCSGQQLSHLPVAPAYYP